MTIVQPVRARRGRPSGRPLFRVPTAEVQPAGAPPSAGRKVDFRPLLCDRPPQLLTGQGAARSTAPSSGRPVWVRSSSPGLIPRPPQQPAGRSRRGISHGAQTAPARSSSPSCTVWITPSCSLCSSWASATSARRCRAQRQAPQLVAPGISGRFNGSAGLHLVRGLWVPVARHVGGRGVDRAATGSGAVHLHTALPWAVC